MSRSHLRLLALILLLACKRGSQYPPAATTQPLALVQLHSELEACFREPAPELRSAWLSAVHHGWRDPRHELARFLADNTGAIALLVEHTGGSADLAARTLPGDGFEPRLDRGARYAELLVLAGRERERPCPDEALRLYLTALRFAHRHIAEEDAPLATTLVGWNMQAIALGAIRDLLHRSRTSTGAWREALLELGSLRSSWRGLTAALASERARTRALLERSWATELDEVTKRALLTRYDGLDAEVAGVLAEAWSAGEPERLREALDSLAPYRDGPGSDLAALLSHELPEDGAIPTLVHLAYAKLGQVLELDMVRKLDLDMLRLAIAVKLYRDEHENRLPDSLGELVPGHLESIPADLFAPSQPLRLAREGSHWWIYSVGPDRVDQGGKSAYDAHDPEAGGDLLSVAVHPRQ